LWTASVRTYTRRTHWKALVYCTHRLSLPLSEHTPRPEPGRPCLSLPRYENDLNRPGELTIFSWTCHRGYFWN
jgi:hypothetical protein